MNLFLAIYEEHRQRTGHDAFMGRGEPLCNVCMYLKAEKDRLDKEEANYYKQLEKDDNQKNQSS